jgi:hypothetical protein
MQVAHFEDLSSNQEAVPSFSAIEFLLDVNIKQSLECFEPDRQDAGRGFVDGVWVLILDHIERGDTLAEY